MSDKQVNDSFRDYFFNEINMNIYIQRHLRGLYTEEEFLSIIDEHASDIILGEDEKISIMLEFTQKTWYVHGHGRQCRERLYKVKDNVK